jgi:hypothetical protein
VHNDHGRRAQQHRPTDPAVLSREIRRLAAGGLHAIDIAQALRMHPGVVREALAHPDSRPASCTPPVVEGFPRHLQPAGRGPSSILHHQET